MMMRYITRFLTILLSFAAAACSQSTTPPTATKPPSEVTSMNSHYQKPGAPITMKSTYGGHTDIGVEDNFDIMFTAKMAGDLTVTIHSEDNILTAGDITISKAVVAGETLLVPVSVVVVEDGKYYLKILTRLNNDYQNRARAFGIAIYAGNWKANNSIRNQKHPSVDGIIIMPAEETIIVQ